MVKVEVSVSYRAGPIKKAVVKMAVVKMAVVKMAVAAPPLPR
jgi:hypothetical protein